MIKMSVDMLNYQEVSHWNPSHRSRDMRRNDSHRFVVGPTCSP
jgi:hypothetical protein